MVSGESPFVSGLPENPFLQTFTLQTSLVGEFFDQKELTSSPRQLPVHAIGSELPNSSTCPGSEVREAPDELESKQPTTVEIQLIQQEYKSIKHLQVGMVMVYLPATFMVFNG